jgi:predicted ATPase with chaperone activity
MDPVTPTVVDFRTDRFAELARRPKSIADAGLSETFLAELLSKHLLNAGVLSITEIARRMCFPARLLEDVLHFMRREARVQVLSADSDSGALRYALTDGGRVLASNALSVSGYVGPVPVPLAHYVETVRAQTVHERAVTADDMRTAFHDVVISDDLLDRLGPSLNSGRAIFIYGPAGVGKTYVAQRLSRVLSATVLIPHAILINDAVVAVFDPVMHKAMTDDGRRSLSLDGSFDERYVKCERPAVIVGGELTEDMLDIQFDASTREFRAPLQLKANNGVFIIDDMGRQRTAPQTVFNRWIVPLEEQRDYLSLGAGRHFSVPFDVVLVFSTNMKPAELADEAFLRRIGYKIRFPYLRPDQYEQIWHDQCRERGVPFDAELVAYAINVLHKSNGVPLLPCHPRDLLGLSLDRAAYANQPRQLTRETLNWAWENYFASTDDADHTDSDSGERR